MIVIKTIGMFNSSGFRRDSTLQKYKNELKNPRLMGSNNVTFLYNNEFYAMNIAIFFHMKNAKKNDRFTIMTDLFIWDSLSEKTKLSTFEYFFDKDEDTFQDAIDFSSKNIELLIEDLLDQFMILNQTKELLTLKNNLGKYEI